MKDNENICPFLGIRSDQNTCAIYPSRVNHCHRITPPERVSVIYQGQCCIGGDYEQCSVYSQDVKGALPEGIAAHKRKRKILSRTRIIVFFVVAISIFAFFWPHLNPQFSEVLMTTPTVEAYFSTPTETQFPSLTPTRTPIVIPSLAPTKTQTPTMTLTPRVETPVATAGPSFATPFGPDQKYLIHSVRAGESFFALANKYHTTKEVIEAINILPSGGGVWAGKKLVIMPDQTDLANLPKFEVIFLDQQMDIIEIAGMYTASVEEVRYYNALGDSSENIPAGRWLIIPVEQ